MGWVQVVVGRGVVALCGAAVAVVSMPIVSTPAAALEAPVAFTSADLPTFQADGIAWAVASAKGKVFVGGTFGSVRPPGAPAGTGEVPRSNLAVFDAATGQPTACAPTFTLAGSQATATVRALTVSPDRKTLYVGGYFSAVDGTSRQHLAAIDIDTCAVVKGFAPLPNATVRTISATDTEVFYGGALTAVGSSPRSRAASARAVGSVDAGSLLPWAPVFDKEVRSLDVKPDGSVVVVGGDFDAVNGTAGHALAVVDSGTGATVHLYPSGFFPARSVVKDVVADSTGFYTASEGTGLGVFDGRVAYDWSGYAQRWRDTCLGATQALALHKGVIYSASHAHECTSMGAFPDGARYHFLAQTIDDPTLLPWFPNTNEGPPTSEAIGPRDLAVATSGDSDYLWSVGEFTSVNGRPQQSITRFGTGPDTVGPSAPTMTLSSPRYGQVRVAWRPSLDTDDATLTYQVFRDGALIATRTAKAWFWDRSQLTFTDRGLAPGSTHAYRISASDGTNTAQNSTRSIKVASSASPYAERVAADGASFLWRYDETSDVLRSDATANNASGTLKGGAVHQVTPAALAGDPSRALTLNGGSSAWIHSEDRYDHPSAYTLETWFRTTTTSGGKLIGFGNKQAPYQSTRYDKHIYMANSGQLVFGVYQGATVTLKSSRSYNDGVWHHVAATQGSGGMALYLDGARVGRNAAVGSDSYTGYWHVGGDNLANWPSAPTNSTLSGSLDETAVYPSALSAATIAEHRLLGVGGSAPSGPGDFYGRTVYDTDPYLYWRLGEASGPAVVDATGGGSDGTAANGVTFGQNGAVAGTGDTAVRLSGTSTSASNGLVSQVSPMPAPSTFSTEAWLRTTSTVGGKLIGFGSSASGVSATADRHVYLRTDGRLTFGVKQSSGALSQATSSAAYNDGSYHHVVATSSTAGLSLYVDGVLVATSSGGSSTYYTGYWRIGGDTLTGWGGAPKNTYLAATIDEVAVYLDALSAAQVSAHFSAGRASVPDTAAPTVPQNVSVGMSGGNAVLSWPASLDNRGVTAYDLYRAASPGAASASLALITTVTSPAAIDSSVPPGDWYYRVVARDAAGNSSPLSNAVGVVIPDTIAPTTPNDVAVATGDDSASLSWSSSSDNIGVSEYVVYRSSTPGFTPSRDSEYASVTATGLEDMGLSGGPYYYRVDARDAAGNLSAPSAEVTARLGDSQPPTTPAEVTTSVTGDDVRVSWTPSTDGSGVAGYDVYASRTSGTPVSEATRIGSTSATSLVVASAPEGTSYYQVVAMDNAGNRSLPSAEVTAYVPPVPTVTTLSPMADTRVHEGSPSVNYGSSASLSSRGSPGAAVSYLRFALPAAPAGKYLASAVLELRTSSDPSAGSTDPHAVLLADDAWQELVVTWRDRPSATGPALGTIMADTVSNSAYATTLDPAALRSELGRQRTLAISGTGTDGLYVWSRDYGGSTARPRLVLTFSSGSEPVTPPSTPSAVSTSVKDASVTVSWTGSTGASRYDVYRASSAAAAPTSATRVGLATSPTFTETSVPGGRWFYRVVAENPAGERSDPSAAVGAEVDVSAPTVPAGLTATVSGSEVALSWSPSTDDVAVRDYRVLRRAAADSTVTSIATTTTTTFTDASRPVGRWVYSIVARDAAGHASEPSGEFEAVVGPVADTSPPSGPASLTATVAETRVDLTWPSATDDVGTTGYDVHRSQAQGFVPTSSTFIAAVTSTSATDPARPAGTWYYRVVARDLAGNRGDPSPEARAVVIGGDPTVIALTPTADTYGNEGAATHNFGTTSSAGSRGSLGLVSYLRFVIPDAPGGMTLASAVLQFRTTTDSFSGSAEGHAIRLAPDSWDESTLTWNDRPAVTGQSIGAIVGGAQSNAVTSASLDVTAVEQLAGQQSSFAITNAGIDSLWFWSSEHQATSYRPQLILTWR